MIEERLKLKDYKMASGVLPLTTSTCPIDPDCTGERWQVNNEDELARLIAIIAMGQASQASYILKQLAPAAPAFTTPELSNEAKIRLTVQEVKQEPRIGYPRWQRDGFIFEAISWIAARQVHGTKCYMKDPHVSATSQGLDGLMLELSDDKTAIQQTTVFEDKCTDYPADTFKYKVIPAFKDRHDNKRSAEIVSAATVLLRMAGIEEGEAARFAAAVTDRSQRRYRAAFALPAGLDSQDGRRTVFNGYGEIKNIDPTQRLGASFVVPTMLRDWFDQLALRSQNYIDSLEVNAANV